MAFTTAPAKAAKAQAAVDKLHHEREEEEEESSLSEVNSSSTQSTIVEVHEEEDPTRKTSFSHHCATVARGLNYTSLWPSAKDVVIVTAPPNTCPDIDPM